MNNQAKVMSIINDWMNNLPAIGNNGEGFTFREIPTVKHESLPDYTLWWNNLCVGAVEIKVRTSEYDSWMIDRPKLEMLYKQYQSKGIPAMLAFAVKNGTEITQVYFADMRVLISARDRWEEAPEENMSTTDHGKGSRKKAFPGFNIPADLFWRLV